MSESVFRSWIRSIYLLFTPPRIVGQHHVDPTIAPRFHVFGAIHRRRTEKIGGDTRVDHHVALVVKAVFGG